MGLAILRIQSPNNHIKAPIRRESTVDEILAEADRREDGRTSLGGE